MPLNYDELSRQARGILGEPSAYLGGPAAMAGNIVAKSLLASDRTASPPNPEMQDNSDEALAERERIKTLSMNEQAQRGIFTTRDGRIQESASLLAQGKYPQMFPTYDLSGANPAATPPMTLRPPSQAITTEPLGESRGWLDSAKSWLNDKLYGQNSQNMQDRYAIGAKVAGVRG